MAAGVLSIAGTAWAGQPSPDPPCSNLYAHAGVQQYRSIERLPPALVAELMRHWGRTGAAPADVAAVIAPRDADWQVTDVVMGQPLPSRRFIMAVAEAGRFHIWYESGGLVHTYHLAILEASSGTNEYRPVAHLQGTLQQLCKVAETVGTGRVAGDGANDTGHW